jgi:hypothetical protein
MCKRVLYIILKVILSFIAFSSPFSYAQQPSYVVINNLSHIQNYIGSFKKGDLVVFDIDGVIITPSDKLLKSCNRKIRRKHFDKLKHDLGEEKFRVLFAKVVTQLNAEFVEDRFPEIFYYIKSQGSKVIALTLMGPNNPYVDQEEDRVRYLRKMGIIFDSIYQNSNIILDINTDKPQPLFKFGIIFTRGYNKGEVLLKLLNNISFKPNRLIFIDNKINNVENFNASFRKSNMEVFSFFYNPSEIEEDINKCIIEKQLDWAKKYSIWLSDRQAYILCQEKK